MRADLALSRQSVNVRSPNFRGVAWEGKGSHPWEEVQAVRGHVADVHA